MSIKGLYQYKNRGQNFLLAEWVVLGGRSVFHALCFSCVDLEKFLGLSIFHFMNWISLMLITWTPTSNP